MKRIFNLLFLTAVISVILSGCSDELSLLRPNKPHGSFDDGVRITLQFPEMAEASTRSIDDGIAPALKDLDLYIFVFDAGNLLETIHIDNTEWDSMADNRISFTAYLPQTDGNAVLHIVAIDDSDEAFARLIDSIGYGIEDSVMPALFLSENRDAYWQRIDLGTPVIVSVSNEADPTLPNVQGTEDKVFAKFENPVPLVRNFAKISLSKDSSAGASPTLADFNIRGWTIVNDLDAGSVVPWYSPSGVSDIVYPDYSCSFGPSRDEMPDYDDLSAQGYQGVSQTGAIRRHTLNEGKPGDINDNGATWKPGDKFLYERKATSQNPLYILLYGEYKGKPGYYKLALGKTDRETGLVTEYNVLRNIAYNIVIKDVSAPGYDTADDAAAGPAFNNISGDVTTKNMTQISDGVDKLYVNFVSYVVTTPGHVIDFKYKFVNDISGTNTPNNNAVQFKTPGIGLEPGNVVKDFGSNFIEGDKEGNYTDRLSSPYTEPRDGSEWRSVSIKANDPTDELQIQSFTIYTKPADAGTSSNGQTGMGLSRTVNLILRQPWNFIRMEVFPGHWEDDSQWPDYDPDDYPSDPDVNYYVGSEIGARLTVFWELPAGLPEAMFPLQFQLESDRQNIENAGIGNAVVQFGPSLFKDVTDSRISYIKTVTWRDYAPDGENSTEASRIVRARFTTTTNIDNPSIFGDAKVSMVKLHNPYFHDIDDQFERNKNKTVEDRDISVTKQIIWDFSSDEWADFIGQCAAKTFAGSVEVNGLNITQSNDNANRRFTGNATGEKYFVMHRSADEITFSLYYPQGAPVDAKLKVVADRDIANNTAVNISAARTPTSVGITSSSTANITGREERVYTLSVPSDELTLTVSLKPNANLDANNGLRIYSIEFYPLGEDL